jgi:hypothetical protein
MKAARNRHLGVTACVVLLLLLLLTCRAARFPKLPGTAPTAS